MQRAAWLSGCSESLCSLIRLVKDEEMAVRRIPKSSEKVGDDLDHSSIKLMVKLFSGEKMSGRRREGDRSCQLHTVQPSSPGVLAGLSGPGKGDLASSESLGSQICW